MMRQLRPLVMICVRGPVHIVICTATIECSIREQSGGLRLRWSDYSERCMLAAAPIPLSYGSSCPANFGW